MSELVSNYFILFLLQALFLLQSLFCFSCRLRRDGEEFWEVSQAGRC